MEQNDFIAAPDDLLLITGATGFIGPKVVESLLDLGFRNLRCFARPSSDAPRITAIAEKHRGSAQIEVMKGNLLSREDCERAMKDVAVVFHLSTGKDGKSFPDAFMNSVVTTRNLLEPGTRSKSLRRFVNISSFAVYTNLGNPHRGLLDESCAVESRHDLRDNAYCFAKIKQDEIVEEYGKNSGVPYVIVRPGYVYGPGHEGITSRVGTGAFGVFLHLGGSNKIPFTYVDNCAKAIALAGLMKGVDGEIFNVVDDDLPSSRKFLRLYKRNVKKFRSIYLPHAVSYALCSLWERYSNWSRGQLPAVYNRRVWHSSWKKTRYTNEKAKRLLGWTPQVSTPDGMNRYFESCRQIENAH